MESTAGFGACCGFGYGGACRGVGYPWGAQLVFALAVQTGAQIDSSTHFFNSPLNVR